MFGLSMWEIAIIALVILFVVGPKRLPDVAKSIGKGYGEFKRTFNEMKQTVNVNDNNIRTSSRQKETSDDKIKSYAEQYKSQWEDKFTSNPDDNPKPTKLEVAALENNAASNNSTNANTNKIEENKG